MTTYNDLLVHTKLQIVQVGHPILRQTARELTRDEILSKNVQQLIEMMRVTMHDVGVGLAAPQVALPLQIAVIEDQERFHADYTQEQLAERGRKPIPFHVIINPKITAYEGEQVEFFEGCLSFEDHVGLTPRAQAVVVECLNEKAESQVIKAEGWYARILQHEIDHLNGKLYIDHLDTRALMNAENYMCYWGNIEIQEVKEILGLSTRSR